MKTKTKLHIFRSYWLEIHTLILYSLLIACGASQNNTPLENHSPSPAIVNNEATLTPTLATSIPAISETITPTKDVKNDDLISTLPPSSTPPITMPLTLSPATDTPTPVISSGLYIASVQAAEDNDELTHKVWILDTVSQENELFFTSPPGSQITGMRWGPVDTDLLYVSIGWGIYEGNLTGQVYEIDYRNGTNRAILPEPLEGLPMLLDISFGGEWLRLSSWVDQGVWFVNPKSSEVIQIREYLSGFVWSPIDMDTFAYWARLTKSVMIVDLPEFVIVDNISNASANWGGEPSILWHPDTPTQLLFYILDDMYEIDLTQDAWQPIASGIEIQADIINGLGLNYSPSGNWILSSSRGGVEALQISSLESEPLEIGDEVGTEYKLIGWHTEEDWIILSTSSNHIYIVTIQG